MSVQPRGRWGKTPVQTFSNLFLKILTEGAVTTEAGSLFQYFTNFERRDGMPNPSAKKDNFRGTSSPIEWQFHLAVLSELQYWHYPQRAALMIRGHSGGRSRKGETRVGLSWRYDGPMADALYSCESKQLDVGAVSIFLVSCQHMSTPLVVLWTNPKLLSF